MSSDDLREFVLAGGSRGRSQGTCQKTDEKRQQNDTLGAILGRILNVVRTGCDMDEKGKLVIFFKSVKKILVEIVK